MTKTPNEKISKILETLPNGQGIYRRHEISIADYLMSFREDLTKEFLAYHTDFIEGDFVKGQPYWHDLTDTDQIKTTPTSWKITDIKYTIAVKKLYGLDYNIDVKKDIDPEVLSHFPTAVKLTEEFGDDCPISTYSILESNSVIKRHTGIENRSGEFVRIHIPLIVPPGEIFFEVNGEEIDWSDLFAFDNQQVHSAYNYTPHRRLVYLIDVRRSRIGLPQGTPYHPFKEVYAKPFIRNGVQLT